MIYGLFSGHTNTLKLVFIDQSHTHTHTHTHIYIYIYIYIHTHTQRERDISNYLINIPNHCFYLQMMGAQVVEIIVAWLVVPRYSLWYNNKMRYSDIMIMVGGLYYEQIWLFLEWLRLENTMALLDLVAIYTYVFNIS